MEEKYPEDGKTEEPEQEQKPHMLNVREVDGELLVLCPYCNKLFHPDRAPEIGR